MTVTINEPIRVGPNAWLQTWSSSLENPMYSVYVSGVLKAKTKCASMTFSFDDSESSVVDIFDNDDLPDAAGEAKADIRWTGAANAKRYKLEKKIATVWTKQRDIEDRGLTEYETRTEPLTDGVVHNFRVIAEGENGNESTAATVDIEPVRHPDIPEVDYSFDDITKTVTLTEI